MEVIINENERSWVIDLISKTNFILSSNDLIIKKAGGESTVSTQSTGRKKNMFPDLILYGNEEKSVILQGWEIKMPDTPIEDEEFIKDAQRKAVALNLNSCIIWNFTYAVLYIRNENDEFSILKQWNTTSYIQSRADVKIYQSDWEQLLEEIIIELNSYFISGQLHNAVIGNVIAENIITTLIKRNKDVISEYLKNSAFCNNVLSAYIDNWWIHLKNEYEHDESDKYKAYAKSIVLSWANRITFAHIIKNRQNGALLINEFNYDTTPREANEIFSRITAKCDFYNIFSSMNYDEIIPVVSWYDFIEYSNFLKNNGIDHLNQEALQNILEGSIAVGKREINGQYATPPELAKILVRLSVQDWRDTILDCCCGTGTIPREAILIKKNQLSAKEAVESVWACDKYKYPLQIANISMIESDTIRIANRIFQHNALSLSVGDDIIIVDPETGEKLHLSLPAFGTVVSNLPFVSFGKIPFDDKKEISKMPLASELDGRSDLYCYIALKIADVMKPGGNLGIITSNSWLGTKAGTKLIVTLRKRYNLKQVHISGKGRWFKNADVVTTILILEKKNNDKNTDTTFWLWKKSLNEFKNDSIVENILINSATLESEIDATVTKMSRYSLEQIDNIQSLNISYNALFHNIEWLLEIKEKIIPINEVFRVFRGSRRGWDALFYPEPGNHKIESKYLKKVLKNGRNVTKLITNADNDAFCCSLSKRELEKLGDVGAIEWISKFSNQQNNVGKPLPEVLQRSNMHWYELKDNEIAEIFTMMNPDKRLFFAKFETPSFVNQRLIGLTHKDDYLDLELYHALLNSMFTMFYIEASGFGRGLGVLDVNKDSIANCYMLNPKLINSNNRQKILDSFEKIKRRKIMAVYDELNDPVRIEFEHEVLRCFDIDDYFDKIKSSLLSMQETRATARK